MSNPRSYSWKAILLAQHSMEVLRAMEQEVMAEHYNPKNERGVHVENGQETIFMYDAAGRRKLDALSWAVYHKTKKKAA